MSTSITVPTAPPCIRWCTKKDHAGKWDEGIRPGQLLVLEAARRCEHIVGAGDVVDGIDLTVTLERFASVDVDDEGGVAHHTDVPGIRVAGIFMTFGQAEYLAGHLLAAVNMICPSLDVPTVSSSS